MAVDDYMESEVGIIAAATAAAVSPKARDLFRRGAVYGLAGVLRTGDVAIAAARGAVRGARDETAAASDGSGKKPTRARRRSGGSRSAASGRSKQSGTRKRSASA